MTKIKSEYTSVNVGKFVFLGQHRAGSSPITKYLNYGKIRDRQSLATTHFRR